MDFEAYLISKKIDVALFQTAEPMVWNAWKIEFEQIHPNSFTAQKLYLINPIRRKYPLKVEVMVKPEPNPIIKAEKITDSTIISTPTPSPTLTPTPPPSKPVVPRPVFKPKPKTS